MALVVPPNCISMNRIKGLPSLLKDPPHSTHSSKDPPYLCPTHLYHREFRLPSETAQYYALNQLTRRFNCACRLRSGCSVVYTCRGKRYILPLRQILRSSFLPNYLLSQPASAVGVNDEVGFFARFT
jgi:hypothetical protein